MNITKRAVQDELVDLQERERKRLADEKIKRSQAQHQAAEHALAAVNALNLAKEGGEVTSLASASAQLPGLALSAEHEARRPQTPTFQPM